MPRTHSLFPAKGYEVAIKPGNLYLGTARPKAGEISPKRGTFYIEMLDKNILDYVVRDPSGIIQQSTINLEELRNSAESLDIEWITPFSTENLARLYRAIWKTTAERGHTWRNPDYIQDRNEYPSDHLLIFALVDDIRIGSWNTMGKGATGFSAYQYDEEETMYDKNGNLKTTDTSAADRRYEKIIDVLVRAKDQQGLNVIHLQETNIDVDALKARLGNNWQIIDSVKQYNYLNPANPGEVQKADAHRNRVVTCFNTDVFQLEEIESITSSHDKERYLKVNLRSIKTNQVTECYNVWSIYNDFPLQHEIFYREKFIQGKARGNNVLIAGDTNTRFAPESLELQNIATAVIPPSFLRENPAYMADNTLLVPDYPDVVIYYSPTGDDLIQPEIYFLNSLGNILFNEPLPSVETMTTDAEKMMRYEYRAIVCLDALKPEIDVANSELLQLQSTIQQWPGEENTYVRATANSLNERGMIISFTSRESSFYKKVNNYLKDKEGVVRGTLDREGRGYPTIMLPNYLVADFKAKLQTFPILRDIDTFTETTVTAQATRLAPSFFTKLFFRETDENNRFKTLSRMKQELLEDLKTKITAAGLGTDREGYQQIIQDWKNQRINKVGSNGQTTEQTVEDCIKTPRFGFGKTTSEQILSDIEAEIAAIVGNLAIPH